MGRWRRIVQIALIIMLVMSLVTEGGAACANNTRPGNAVELTVLSVNDFHGALVETEKNPGIAKLGNYIMEEKRKNPAGTLVLSAGDMFQGSADSNILYGKTVIAAMNEIGVDAMVVGNHEFDWGMETLKRGIAQAKFPYLGANVLDKRTGKTVEFLRPYVIIKKNGIKIAIIGLATPETAYKSAPKVVGDFVFADPVQTVHNLLPIVRKQAQVIIVLSHLGCAIDQNTGEITGEAAEFAKTVQGVDLIVTGHTHQKIAGKINEIPVVQAGQYGRTVAKVKMIYAPAGGMIVSSVTSLTDLPTPGLTGDQRLAEILEQDQKEIAGLKNTIVGKTLGELPHERFELSLLGQWSTDVMREAVKADIAFQNGGGLRTSLPAGNITIGNLYETMPFDNTLYVVELSGRQVLQVLQHGIKNPQVGMIQFSGIQVKYDASMPENQRIIAVHMADGKALDLNRSYKVVTNDFMAGGGDAYTVFKEGKNGFDTNIAVRDALIEALKNQPNLRYTGDDRFMDISKAERKAA